MHDEDVRLVRDRMCQMCTGEDETTYSDNCRRPKATHDCWLHAALDRILARYDALMEEHEAVGNDRGECFMPGGKGGCDYCQYTDTCAAHDKVEGLLRDA